jgi:hypothetical protein
LTPGGDKGYQEDLASLLRAPGLVAFRKGYYCLLVAVKSKSVTVLTKSTVRLSRVLWLIPLGHHETFDPSVVRLH